MSRQLIVVKVVLDDGATKTIRCEPNTTIAEIKEQFSYRYKPEDHRICFADGRVGDESMVIGAYRIEEGAVLYLRNKQLSVPHNVEPDDLRKPSWISTATGQQLTVPPVPSSSAIANATATGASGFSLASPPVLTNPVMPTTPPDQRSKSMFIRPSEVVDVEHETDGKVRVTKLRTFLAHFLRRRPNAEDLIRAKIIEEAPAVDLVQPTLDMVKQTCDWLLANAIDTEGLFRISATKNENVAIADQLVAGKITFTSIPLNSLNVHSVSTGLKLYLRERTSPLIPYKYYKNFLTCLQESDHSEEATKELCQLLVSALPANNQMILIYLFKFLSKVSAHSDTNKMTPRNLGVVFGPVIVRPSLKGMESYQECQAQIELAESLVRYSDGLSFGVQSRASTMSRTICGSTHETVAPVRPKTIANPKSGAALIARLPTLPRMKAPSMPQSNPSANNSQPSPSQQHAKAMPVFASLPSAGRDAKPAAAPASSSKSTSPHTSPSSSPAPHQLSAPAPASTAPVPALASAPAAAAPSPESAQKPQKSQSPPKGLLKDKQEEWVISALKIAQPGTFALLQSENRFRVHCVGQNHNPYVFEIRKVEGKETWALEYSPDTEYSSVNDIIDSLAASGVTQIPLSANAPVSHESEPSKTRYGHLMDDALNNTIPMDQALGKLTNLIENGKDEACKVILDEPRLGEFLLAAGCAIVS